MHLPSRFQIFPLLTKTFFIYLMKIPNRFEQKIPYSDLVARQEQFLLFFFRNMKNWKQKFGHSFPNIFKWIRVSVKILALRLRHFAILKKPSKVKKERKKIRGFFKDIKCQTIMFVWKIYLCRLLYYNNLQDNK